MSGLPWRRVSARVVTWSAMLIALSVVLTRVASIRIPVGGIEAIRIGFGALPILFAGITGGPLLGFLVGALADLVGYGINPMGPYSPLITLSSGLLGLIPGLVMKLFLRSEWSWGKVALGVAVAQVVVGMAFTPWALHVSFGVPYAVLIPPRLVSKPLEIVAFSLLIRLVTVPLARRGMLPVVVGK